VVFECVDLAEASPALVTRCAVVALPEVPLTAALHRLQEKLSSANLKPEQLQGFETKLLAAGSLLELWELAEPSFAPADCGVRIEVALMTFGRFFLELSASGDVDELGHLSEDFAASACALALAWSIQPSREKARLEVSQWICKSMALEDLDLFSMRLDREAPHLRPFALADSVGRSGQLGRLFVPSMDHARAFWLYEHTGTLLLRGPAGCGKTTLATEILDKAASRNESGAVWLRLSAHTAPKQLRATLEDVRHANRALLVADDVAVAPRALEGERAQPVPAPRPVEVLRELLERGKAGCTLLAVAGTVQNRDAHHAPGPVRDARFLAALRFERFAGHFLVSPMEAPSREKLTEVYSARICLGLGLGSRFFSAVYDVYDFAKSSFKRSPNAPYLTFTYRDVARTFQGILKALEGFGGSAPTEALLLESFLHEVARVFEDKLKIQLQKDLLRQELRRLRSFRGMTVTPNDSEESEAPRRFLKRLSASIEKPYERVEEEQLWRCFQESLEEYRQLQAGDGAFAAFFLSAEVVDQLCRLLRTGALARSHLLLLGLLGSGRRSLCGLAAHLLDAVYFQTKEAVTERDFLQMLRVVWRTCGAKQSDCILVLADEDLREDGVLDSISAVLDLGHVPELCSPDEIANMLREALDFKDLAVHIAWPRFLDRVHQHLHLVLCLSPMDGGFRILRKFPKLICCCSVSHVEAWKVDSWQAMAEQRLNETDCQGAIQAAKSRLARCLAQSQELFAASATVRSFSQVLQNFTQLWRLKSAQVAKRRGRLERALQAVARAPGVLEELQRKVQGLQAEVEEQEAKLRELRDVAACIAADVQRAQEQLREAEVFAEAKESACKSLQAEVQGAMDEVVQPYRTAVKAFEKADKKEVSELKNFAAPPPLILAIMEMVAMLFGCSVEWSAAKNLISESNFGKRFRDFDKDHLSDALSTRLKAEVSRADFNPTLVESQSKAAKFICNWLRALAAYDEVYRSTAGLRDRAGQTESEAEAARRELASKQAELKSLEDKAMEPAKMLEEAQSQMEILMNELDAGAKRTGLVSQVLHGGLFAEQGSWEKQLAALTRSSESLPGECMFAAVCLAYLGPVAPARRPLWEESLKNLWAEYDFNFSEPVHHQWELESVRSWDEDVDVDPSGSNVDSDSERGAPGDGSLWTLPSFLFDEVSEQEWNAQGLPAALAVSAALALKVPFMPLCLDPHEQACRWLRKVIPSLTVTHAASPKLGQALTACRQEGLLASA